MSSEEDTIEDEGVDSGYGASLSRGSGESIKSAPEDTATDETPQSDDATPEASAQTTDTSSPTTDSPSDTSPDTQETRAEPHVPDETSSSNEQPEDSLYAQHIEDDVDWGSLTNNEYLADHAETVAANAPSLPRGTTPADGFDLIPQYDQPMATYISTRPKPVYDHLEQLNVSVRPELKEVIEKAKQDAEDFYAEDDFHQADFYAALLIRGLMSYDSSLGIMALHGYGMKG